MTACPSFNPFRNRQSARPPHVPRPHRLRHRGGGAGVAAQREQSPARRCRRAAGQPRHRSIRCTSRRKAKRIIFLTMAGGPSHLETLDYKPKLAEMHGQPMPESFTKGQPIAQLQGQGAEVLRPAAPVQEVRQVGPGNLRDLSADRHDRRRDLHRPLAADRGDQPRPGSHVHEHGHDDLRPAVDGLVADLWPGGRDRQPARASSCSPRPANSASRSRSPSRQWSAGFLPSRFQGVELRSQGRSGAVCESARRASRSRSSSDVVDAVDASSTGCEDDAVERSGNRHAHRPVRAGVQDADQRAGAGRYLRRAAARARPVRHARGRRHVRRQLPAGPPAGRAGRAVHSALSSRLGPSRQPQGADRRHRQGSRSGRARPWSPTSRTAACSRTR